MKARLVVDAHLDLGMSALDYNRDLTQTVGEIRSLEGDGGHRDVGVCTVALPEMAEAGVVLCGATLFARVVQSHAGVSGWQSPELARAAVKGQLAYYEALADMGLVRIITSGNGLTAHLTEARRIQETRQIQRGVHQLHHRPPGEKAVPFGMSTSFEKPAPLGIILVMECADPLRTPADLDEWVESGVRAVGPAHYGPNRYAHGTGSSGGLVGEGRELLRRMDELGVVLDTSHLADDAFWEALRAFIGPVMASHSNCRALAPGNRQLADEQIQAIAEREGVIGIALEIGMLAGERAEQKGRDAVDWSDVVQHIDHICQLTGTHRHVGLGTDLDGGFGRERTPAGFDTIADVTQLAERLETRGYASEHVDAIVGGNWIRFWERVLPRVRPFDTGTAHSI